MDLWVWSGNKKAEWRVESQWFASQQKSAQESFKNQDHAHCFFFSIFEEGSITNLFHTVRQLMPHFVWKFWNVCVKVCDVYNLNCGQKRTGSCITTMHPHTRRLLCTSFSPKTIWLPRITLPIHLI
jgi:hypothetical protein